MKSKIRFFFEVNEESYYILYNINMAYVLYRIDNINPLMFSQVASWGAFDNKLGMKIIKEIEEFALKEFEKLQNGF
ncbi:hypothetical protein [Chryseobacterium defluvii]|uniref:Uncharacterized protein n=1 Tax=Chryseobacterium defluvii TaxID=160396 RepID=A0A495SN20_9FLAO|nr:hypothetical protein [Chryseobacterium defluvii]RKT01115.1 hypothetical protein BCF58_0329 [Chryseobacterium defluvii]